MSSFYVSKLYTLDLQLSVLLLNSLIYNHLSFFKIAYMTILKNINMLIFN